MKRIISLLIALVVMATLVVTVNANDVYQPYGAIPRVPTGSIAIDGNMDPAYQSGVAVQITRDHFTGEDRSQIGEVYGTMYMIYDENNLYVYVYCVDSSKWNAFEYYSICDICGKQEGVLAKDNSGTGCEHSLDKIRPANLWDDDCVEFFIDWQNLGGHNPSQYRVSRSNFISRDWDTQNLGFTGAASDAGSTWGAEFAIPLDVSNEGFALGVFAMIHSQEGIESSPLGKFSENIAYAQNEAEYGGTFEADFYSYITLGPALPDNPITDTSDPESSGPSDGPSGPSDGPSGPSDGPRPSDGPDPSNPGYSGPIYTGPIETDESGNTIPPTDEHGNTIPTAPSGNKNLPKTADPIASVVLCTVAALGAIVVVKKTCFKK